jgi:hypothetical protein
MSKDLYPSVGADPAARLGRWMPMAGAAASGPLLAQLPAAQALGGRV